MRRQLDLFGSGLPVFDPTFATLRRTELAEGAWVDHAPGWVAAHDVLFDQLERGLAWRSEEMYLYERIVTVPRLLAAVAADGPGQPLLEEIRRALSARYGEEFVRTTAALYRDGNDSVAFHGDTTARDMDTALVAQVSLGFRRRLLLRPTAGGPSIAFPLGGGDLFVMGGTCQRTWRHGVPKVAAAGPRIVVMFRPRWGETYGSSS
jgi:alkylated DNA repair dioxygenase AlkB